MYLTILIVTTSIVIIAAICKSYDQDIAELEAKIANQTWEPKPVPIIDGYKYTVSIIDLPNTMLESVIMTRDFNYFKHHKNALYAIVMNYDGKTYDFTIYSGDYNTEEFIKVFNSLICIRMRELLIEAGLGQEVDYRLCKLQLLKTIMRT